MRLSKATITQSIRDQLNGMSFVDVETLLGDTLVPNRTYKISGKKFGFKSCKVKVRFSAGVIVDFNYATPTAMVKSVRLSK